MKKLYFLPFLFWAITGFAQKQFVVQNGTAQTFDDLNVAISAASAGDTIYLPGGGFTIPNQVDKTLHWRGVGHYPDSTIATGATQITTYNVYFTGDCDNSTFEGIYFQNNVIFGSNTDECTGVIIRRCRVGGTLSFRATNDISSGYPNLNFYVSESVLATLDANNGMNLRLEKNLIFNIINDFYQSFFNHNSVNIYNNSSVIRNCKSCQFINNVFSYYTGIDGNTANCNFQNNLFQGGNLPAYLEASTHSAKNNISGITAADIYTNISHSNIYTFSYDNDYHLKAGSPGIGAATDGTNMGIYGTSLPYKEGAVPYAPHIRTADIDNEAVNDELGVQIKVAAQER